MTQVTQAEINKTAWNACHTLRGSVDPSIYKDYVLTLLFLKYISDVRNDPQSIYCNKHPDPDGPEMTEAMIHRETLTLPNGASFDALHKLRHEPGNGKRIDKALTAIEKANGDKLRDVFRDIRFNSSKLGDEKQKNDILRHLLEAFAVDTLDLRQSRVGGLDIIGGAYEYLISHFAATAGKKAGEFYTPAEVSDLMARLANPQPGDDICDPACGSASLLMKCGRLIRNSGGKDYVLYGQEAIGSTWALARMNLFLHDEVNHQIEWGDTIRNPKLRTRDNVLRCFDIVVANPPFSLDKWGIESAETDKFDRFRRGIPPRTRGDYAFILHMVETLKPRTGRAVIVVPHGVLFRGSSEGKIRQKLIEENLLDAVINLPGKLFFGTGIPAAILVFRKHKTDDSVIFIDASREFIPGTNQNTLDQTHIDRIVASYEARQTIKKYAYRAKRAEIVENNYNLNTPRYVDTFEEEEEIDLMSVRAEREGLMAEQAKLETRMAGYLQELGYAS